MSSVSVIIPTNCRPHLLPRAVESARTAGTNVEIIVVDDASTDETAAISKSLSGVRYVRLERNQGVAGARNIGILESSGEYLAFLDDDDQRLPGSLDLQIAALEKNPEAGFCCGAMIMANQEFEPTGEVIRPPQSSTDVFTELLELGFPVMPLSTLIRRRCLLSVGLLNSHISGIDDWDILTRMSELYPVVVLNEPIGIYRQPTPSSGQGSSTRAKQLRQAAHHQKHLLNLPRAMLDPAARTASRRRGLNRIADSLLWDAAGFLTSGQPKAAGANILVALQLRPTRALRPGAYKRLVKRIFLSH